MITDLTLVCILALQCRSCDSIRTGFFFFLFLLVKHACSILQYFFIKKMKDQIKSSSYLHNHSVTLYSGTKFVFLRVQSCQGRGRPGINNTGSLHNLINTNFQCVRSGS